jgi:hypothetical protein
VRLEIMVKFCCLLFYCISVYDFSAGILVGLESGCCFSQDERDHVEVPHVLT